MKGSFWKHSAQKLTPAYRCSTQQPPFFGYLGFEGHNPACATPLPL